MRDIKFRAWDGYDMIDIDGNKKLVFWNNPHRVKYAIYRDPEGVLVGKEDRGLILMQFTGLKDKNGKEIYEGDIIEIKHPHRDRYFKGEVIYDQYCFSCEGFYFSHFDIPCDIFSEGVKYIEVIGNLYENKDLLNG